MQESSELIIVYTTCPSLETAEEIGRALVKRRQAACVNILPRMVSIYAWADKVQRDEEVAVLIKTQAALSALVIQTIKDLHPYETPAAFILPTSGGSKEFITWITEQTDGIEIQ